MVLRANLTSLTVDDLMESTLYSKILSIEDDRLFDFKYVKNSPKHKEVGIEEENVSQQGDGSVCLRIGRMHFVYLHRIVTEVQHFFEPFTQPELMSYMKKSAEHAVQEQIMELKKQSMKLHLSVDIHAPTIMVPQKSASPNLLVLSLGDLSVENLFKEVHIPSDGSLHLVDNILMRLNSLQLCRAIILLDGILQHQEPILEPVKFRLDIKRALKPFHRDILMFDVTGSIDIIKINIGQKDLSTIFSIYQENFAEGNFLKSKKQVSSPITPVEAPTPTVSEDSVRKLEAFFNSSMDVYKETSFSFVMEGIQLTLYTDSNEVLSSPVRDSAHALSTFHMDEIHMSVEMNNDRSLEFKCSLQAATLEDVRPESHLALRKIFQSYSGDSRLGTGIMGISLSMPPMVDLSYRQNSSGDAEVNILVEKTRLNLSISYILAVLKLVYDSLPSENVSVVNENDSSGHFSLGGQQGHSLVVGRFSHVRLPSDTTSGYYSVVSSTENESRGLSVSAKLKKPEIILFADPMDKNSQVLVLKMDIIFDYSRNGGQENVMANVAGLHMLSCSYGNRKETMCTVLHPCDAEFSRTQKMTEDQIGMEIRLSHIDLHISALIVQTIMDVTEELIGSVKDTDIDNFEKNIPETSPLQDLWSPKKIIPLKIDSQEAQEICVHPSYPVSKSQETLALHIPELKITCDIVEGLRRVPVLFLKLALESDFHNWSKQLYLKADLQLEMMYYNEKLSTWEPLVEPVMEVENVYRPWEVTVKLFRERSQPIVCRHESNEKAVLVDVVDGDQVSVLSKALTESSSSEEEVDNESEMTIIKKQHTRPKRMASQKSHDLSSLVGYAPDSDSENEEGLLERITSAFGQLFSGESSDEGQSDSEELGDGEAKSDSGDTEMADASPLDDEPVFLDPGRGADEVDNFQESTASSSLATYIVIDSSDNLNLNITPSAINVVKEVFNSFLNKSKEDRYLIPENMNKPLLLKNFLGPESTISVLEKLEETSEYILLEEASGKLPGSTPISPGITGMLVDITPNDTDADISGDETDGFNLRAFLAKRKDAIVDVSSAYLEENIEDLYRKTTKTRISVKVEGFDILQCPMPHRAGVTMFALQPIRNKTRYYLIIDVDMYHGQKSITVSSPLVIHSHLSDAVHILCKRARLEEVVASSNEYARNPFHNKFIRLVTLESGESYNVPLFVAYHCKLYVQPATVKTDSYKYDVSTEGLWWQDIAVFPRNRKHITCIASSGENSQYCVKVTCVENKGVKCPAVGTKVVPNYTLHLYPPVIIHNALPYTLEIAVTKTGDLLALHEGESVPLLDIEPGHVREISIEAPNYLGVSWKGKLELSADTEEHHTVLMQPDMDIDGSSKQLVLNVHLSHQHALDVYIYAPYWVVNKTGLPVQLKGSMSDVIYNTISNSHEPLLFRFKKHKRKKARIRVYNSRWSPSFSLDTVGNTGVVVCHDNERKRKYKLFLSNQLSHLQLTKIIIITPFLVVMNNTQQYLRFMEENEQTDLWLDIAPSQCLPFWPDTESMMMFVKHRDSNIISQHFSFKEPCITVLRMDHGSALCVEVTGGSETPTVISFFPYCPGDAPVCVENLCEDLFLKINQKSLGQVTLLSPYQSVLYTWDDPSLERTLIWNLYNRKKNGFSAQIFKDGFGHEQLTFHSLRPAVTSNQTDKSPVIASSSDDDDSESEDGIYLPRKTRKDKVDVYWVSFLDGHQRVLLFTQDERIASHARKAIDGEMATLECFLSLNSIGVSLINRAYTEVAYLGLCNAPPIWEIQINNSWKFLTLDLSAWLEDKWKAEFQIAQLKDYLYVDLSKMQMTKPFFGHLRRTYTPGLWFQFRKSDHQMYMHFKTHRMQVENQLPDAVFPTVFYSAPTPKAIIRRSGPRPFVELKLLTHRTEDLNLDTIKYFNLLVQQMNVKLDKGFLLSVYDMYTSLFQPEEEKSLIKADLSAVEKPLKEINVGVGATRSQRTVFEYIHVSPLKIQFSFSPRGGIHKAIPDPWSLQDDVLDFFLNSVGATLSEVKDVELRMAYFERKGALLTPSQLLAEVEAYYISQVVRQVYVLILGLDVLGNPFGLVRDFTHGLGDFFYEPFLGSVEGPEEFADGLARGAQSLLGHVIGGTATSISLISGSLGQALALLSFDEDYKKKRQQHIHQASSSLPNTLAVAAKGFVMGVALGLSGVVVKPVTGAHQEGVEGFFKGIGKGLMGLITKPAGGVVDMVSMAFDGIRRAAEFGEDVVVRLRLPRFINPSQGLKPYSPYMATGYKLLLQISKGHYADSDRYWAHAALSKEERSDVALITDHHVFLLEKCRFWGGWDVEWVVNLDNILSVPVVQGYHLVIKVRQDENLLNFSGDERYIKSNDPQVLEWLKEKVEKVLLVNMEDRPCPTLV
ncbi:vacuolar protein sorting-associated protein 13C-like [Limulus polyphemus]|uniref:Vacuolar protein sorting-associated protein 13C-like n=1 Tax=Limulus polyphemus TaxID=6850 RepID=A0ABM1SKZ3_LIMPO|nr:vacuolar protein sorting-associated protein 13C-like [Limulus polyphemus]